MSDPGSGSTQERLKLLAESTSLFSASLDPDETMRRVLELFVPAHCDWAVIELAKGPDGDGPAAPRREAATSIDAPQLRTVIEDLIAAPGLLDRPEVQRLLLADEPQVVHIDSPADIPLPPNSDGQGALLANLLPVSMILAPLRARGELLGVLQVISVNGQRRFGPEEAQLVEDVAQRAAYALHTASLVARLQQELELRRATARQLEQSEARYRRMFEGSPYPVWVFDVENHRFLAVNSAASHTYGYSAEEFLAMSIEDIRLPEDVPALRAALEASGAGIRESGIFRHRRKDGGLLLAEVRAHTIDFNGREARMVQAIDVTERVRTYEALRLSEERHHLVASVTKEAIFEWYPGSGAMEWNPTFFELFQFAPNDVIPTREWYESRMHPDDRDQAAADLDDALRWGREQSSHRFRFQRGDGTFALVEGRAVIAYHNGVPARVIGSVTDVTVQQQLSDQLAIAQRMEAVGRLAGGVAHDFNNVLTAIRGFASFALDEQLPASPAHADLEEVLLAVDRAAALTRQLLAFSRRQVLQPQLVDVNEILRSVQRMLLRVLGEDVEVHAILSPHAAPVMVDPGQLEQVIMNVVVNARDAMPSGGRLTIETSEIMLDDASALVLGMGHDDLTSGAFVVMAFTDTGIGMDARTLERIFEPFFSTKDRDKGTGLGLATSYGIIKQSGGVIRVHSEPGHGSTFKVYLPRATTEASTAPLPAAVDSVRLTGDETILLVEDDDRVRRVSSSALQRHGYRVLEARSAEAALSAYVDRIGDIHLVLTDVVLPGKSGPLMMRELQALRPSLPVLYVSGYTENAFLQSGMIEPGIDLLEKPFAPETLLRRVRAILDRPAPA